MSDYDDVMEPITTGAISALEEISQIIDSFPAGKDEFLGRYWIIHAIECGTADVVALVPSRVRIGVHGVMSRRRL